MLRLGSTCKHIFRPVSWLYSIDNFLPLPTHQIVISVFSQAGLLPSPLTYSSLLLSELSVGDIHLFLTVIWTFMKVLEEACHH